MNKKISSYRFRWDNSVRANQISLTSIFEDQQDEVFDNDDVYCVLNKQVKFVGYCEAHKLGVMPNEDGFALMIEFPDGQEYWVHNICLPKDSD